MSTATQSRTEWLADRRTGIGASESPVVLGLSPFKTPYQLWAEKTLPECADVLDDNEPAEWGLRLEQPIADAFGERTCRAVKLWSLGSVKHRSIDWLRCTPDAVQESSDRRGEGLLQIKTTSAYNAADWADGPPLAYQVQAQHELAVTEYQWGTLCVLIGGQKLKWFDFDINPRFIEALIPKLRDFWQAVESRTPPPVDGSLATAKVLARLHPDDSGETVMLPPEAADWTANRADAIAQIEAAEKIKTEAENRIKAALGDATFGVMPDGSRWSWKTQERRGYTVEASKCRVLRKLK